MIPFAKSDPTKPAWTRESYENEMADRIVSAAATMRHANNECGRIQNNKLSMFDCRRDPDWRYWDGQRGSAANEICLLARGMGQLGYDTDPKALGAFLREKYHALLRNLYARAKGDPAVPADAPIPIRMVHDSWLEGLNLPETLALAPAIWKSYLDEHASKNSGRA